MSGGSDFVSVHLQEYLGEAADIIEEIEQVLIAMEGQEDQDHLWECLVRDIHAFKGSAQLMGLGPIVSLAHSMESVITKYRRSKGNVDRTLMEICFDCIETVRELADELSKSGTCTNDITAVLAKIGKFTS